MERMLRPQGLFQTRLPAPAEWQQPAPPAPPAPPSLGAYPPPGGGQYPQASPYPQGAPWGAPPGAPPPYPSGNQYPPTGAFQQAAPPQAWGPPPVGDIAPGQPGYPAGGPYPPAGPHQEPYAGGGQVPGGGQYEQGQFPGGQFSQGVQYAPDGMPFGGGEPGASGLLGKLALKRPKGRLVPVTAAVGVVLVVVVALTLSTQGGSSNAPGAGSAGAASPGAATSSGATAMTQSRAATALSGLLAQSGGDRADVGAAVVNVEACGKNLAKDVRVFNEAAANRHALLTRLRGLPGLSALPSAMIADLTGGWQASATVDTDLARWAQDQVGHCKKGNTKDPHYAATIPFDSKATNDKNAFVRLWNPLAKKDGLPARQASDL